MSNVKLWFIIFVGFVWGFAIGGSCGYYYGKRAGTNKMDISNFQEPAIQSYSFFADGKEVMTVKKNVLILNCDLIVKGKIESEGQ